MKSIMVAVIFTLDKDLQCSLARKAADCNYSTELTFLFVFENVNNHKSAQCNVCLS